MWFFEKKKVRKSFKKIRNQIKHLQKNSVNKKQVEKMIKEALQTPRINPRLIEQAPQTAIRRKANKILNRVEIMQEMSSLLKQGLSTGEILQIIVNEKMLIKKTCFFKYMKIIREQSARTPQTKIAN